MNRLLRGLLMAPTWQFLLLGAVAWAIHAYYADDPPVLVIDTERIEQTTHDWEERQGVPLSDVQRRAIRDELVEEAVLVEFARAAGLDQSDVVRQRLVKLARFLDLVGVEASDTAAMEAARDLGLQRSDPVIRHYLANTAELVLENRTGSEAIDDEAVIAYYADHEEELRQAAVLALSHIFVADESENGRRRAQQILAAVGERELSENAAIALGNVFYGGHVFANRSTRQLAGMFGDAFAQSLKTLADGRWSGPVRSAYGWHIVYKQTLIPAHVPELALVSDTIRKRLERDRKRAELDRQVSALRDHYRIVVGGRG
jgi:hypothetical protein